jgi:quercetin 2,3-dioxygenase
MHAEMNASPTERVNLLQLWIKPNAKIVPPTHATQHPELIPNALTPIVTPHQSNGGLTMRQDATLYLAQLDESQTVTHVFGGYGRGAYVFVIDGEISIDNQTLHVRDAAAVADVPTIKIEATTRSRVLFIDVPLR